MLGLGLCVVDGFVAPMIVAHRWIAIDGRDRREMRDGPNCQSSLSLLGLKMATDKISADSVLTYPYPRAKYGIHIRARYPLRVRNSIHICYPWITDIRGHIRLPANIQIYNQFSLHKQHSLYPSYRFSLQQVNK